MVRKKISKEADRGYTPSYWGNLRGVGDSAAGAVIWLMMLHEMEAGNEQVAGGAQKWRQDLGKLGNFIEILQTTIPIRAAHCG